MESVGMLIVTAVLGLGNVSSVPKTEVMVLEDKPDVGVAESRQRWPPERERILPENAHRPGCGGIDRPNDVQESALTGPRRAGDHEYGQGANG